MENNLNSIFDSLQLAVYADLEKSDIDVSHIQGEKYGFLKNAFIKYLTFKKQDDGLVTDSVLIQIEQFDIAIVYEQSSTGFLNLDTKTVRKNKILLAGWLETKSKNPLWKSLNVTKTFVEKLTTDNLSELDESPYSFTRGQMTEASLWVNVMEPVMASSAVALLVYLFFSVRS